MNDCRGEAKKITLAILREWIRGDRVGVSWQNLAEALRNCQLSYLADQILMAAEKGNSEIVITVSTIHEIVMRFLMWA